MKSKTTAILLCLFLGGFGIHKFYLGESGKGIMYLLFFWTGIPCLLALFGFIGLLVMSDDEFNWKYNHVSSRAPQAAPNNNVNTIAINMGGAPQSSTANSNSDEIMKLYEMKEKGIITEEDFELKKKTLL